MRVFPAIKHTYAINIILILMKFKLILDITVLRWYSEHLLNYKVILLINTFLFILFNSKKIPMVKSSRLAMLNQDDYLNLLKKLIKMDTVIYLILLISSYLLSMALFESRTDYLLGIFGLFIILFLGFKSFKTR